jgi:hypothetical protein
MLVLHQYIRIETHIVIFDFTAKECRRASSSLRMIATADEKEKESSMTVPVLNVRLTNNRVDTGNALVGDVRFETTL